MEWKSLNFFDTVPLVNENRNKLKYVTSKITSYCCNSTFNAFCDVSGYIHVLGTSWEKPFTFRAHMNSVLKSDLSNELNFLVVIAEETAENDVLVQVFNITNIHHQKNGLSAICCTRLNTSSRICSLKIAADNQSLSIAIGCEKGDLYLHQGAISSYFGNDILRKVTTNVSFRCFSLNKKSIIAIEIFGNNLLFCTDTDVVSYTINESGLERRNVLDSKAPKVECTAIGIMPSHAEPYFLIGRNDAIYFFTSDGLGPCYGLGPFGVASIKSLALFKTYLVIVATKCSNPLTQISSTSLIILDIQNKLVVLEKCFDDVVGVLCNESQCYFFTSSNELYVMQEYSTQTKVQLLLKKGLFDIAIRFAAARISEAEILANVYLKYGDHLLSKGNFDAALKKYDMTLGIIDPYVIIQKLLDSRLNSYLYQYLEALLKSGHAKKQHIKLMLRCNERCNLSGNVETYLNTGNLPGYCLAQLNDKKLEEKAVIDVSYQAFLNIIENDKLVNEFFASMGEEAIYKFFSEHGRLLFKNHSARIIQILQHICLSNHPIFRSPERFVPLLLEHKNLCSHFLEHISESGSNFQSSVYNIFFELLLQSNCFRDNLQKFTTFIDSHASKLNETHILLVCKLYTFLLGIDVINKRFPRKNTTNLEFLWPEVYITLCTSNNEPVSSKEKLMPHNAPQKRMREMKSSSKFLLEIMHGVFRHKEISVSQVQDIFGQGNCKNTSHVKNITLLFNQVRFLNEALQNYLYSPIEFRSNICNICRQEIYLPASFHLCQHVFHKDCLTSYSLTESCSFCSSSIKQPLSSPLVSSLRNVQNFELKNISTMLASCIMRTAERNYFKYCSTQNLITIPSEYATPIPINPFDDAKPEYTYNKNPFEYENTNALCSKDPFEEYDSNLNPFNEDSD